MSNDAENPVTHKALAKLHAKLDRIERKIDRLIGPEMVHGVSVVKARPKWIDGFIPDQAKSALVCGYKGQALAYAFFWKKTSEGMAFWNNENNNLRNGKPLSDIARTALTRMITEYEAMN